jgi:hypothetical protein
MKRYGLMPPPFTFRAVAVLLSIRAVFTRYRQIIPES